MADLHAQGVQMPLGGTYMAIHSYLLHPAYKAGRWQRARGDDYANPHDAGNWRSAAAHWAFYWGYEDEPDPQTSFFDVGGWG